MTPPASNPPSPAPSTEVTPRGLNDSGLKFVSGDGVPSWAIGKTAGEVLKTANELHIALQRNDPAPVVSPPSPPPVSPPMSTNGIPDVDANLIYSNPAEYHRQMEARTAALIDARLAAASSAVVTPLASLARSEAARDAELADVWRDYAPDIDLIMQRVPEGARGRVDLWREAAQMVAGKRYKELAQKEAARLVSTQDAGMLSTQGGPNAPRSTSSTSPIARLYNEDHPSVKGFKADGISADALIAHGRKMGHDEAAYAEMLTKRAARRPQPVPIQ